MLLSELIRLLRLEYHDVDHASPLLDDEQLTRAISQGLAALKKDLKQTYTLSQDGVVSPSPESEDRELIVLYGLAVVCRMMQAQTARGFSFSSGDKRIDKTKQPSYWAELGRGYLDQYRQAIQERNPEYGIGVPMVTPAIYGSDSESF
jgi:hypothetical protein